MENLKIKRSKKMKTMQRVAILMIAIGSQSCSKVERVEVEAPSNSTCMFLSKPADNWHQAFPIGNGRMGGMVFGGVSEERIQTNDDTFWSGEVRDVQNPEAANYLPKIRQLLLDEKNREAEQLIDSKLLGPYNECYLPLADILFKMNDGEAENYHRELDLNRGVITIKYKQNGINYQREIFASYPDQAIVIRMTADQKGGVFCKASLTSQVKHEVHRLDENTLIINGRAPIHADPHYLGEKEPVYEEGHGMRFESRLMLTETDGTVQADSVLTLSDATEATFVYVSATSYNGFEKNPFTEGKDEKALCTNYLNNLVDKSYIDLYNNHVKDYAALFGRVAIDLGDSSESTLPLDERIENYSPEKDPSLTALYFQFGRYLLISSSRPGSQPANLQGIWNKDMQPAWSSNWTINCNTQLNYFPVEMVNLSECHLPLFDMIRESTVDGAKTARNLYHSRGWMAHHNLDIWRTTWPIGGSGLWAVFQVGGAWLCQHIWDHYQYTLDEDFLRSNYPILRDAALFYVDNLQQDKEGYLVTNPSESFENGFLKPNGETGWACIGSAQDMQIIRALFKNTMAAIDLLGESKQVRNEIQASYDRLAPMKISPRTGQLQEWNDDWEAASPKNGQVGHGWAFVASDLITLRGTPELAAAFRKTIECRKPEKSYNSGSWTGAFPANYWARFEEGDSVQYVLDRHITKALFPNLTCQFTGYWEIDGNLGFTAAIAQMLLQSHAGEINLLPALPSKYPTGVVKGLKARGGYEVSLNWKDGKLVSASIFSVKGGDAVIRYKNTVKRIKFQPNEKISLDPSLAVINY